MASATSLLALLVMHRHHASATPVVVPSTQPIDFGGVLVHRADAPLTSQWAIDRHPVSDIRPSSPASGLFANAGDYGQVGAAGTDGLTVSNNFSPSASTASTDTDVGTGLFQAGKPDKGSGVAPSANSPATSVIANFALGDPSFSDVQAGSRPRDAHPLNPDRPGLVDNPPDVPNEPGDDGASVFVGTTASISLQAGGYAEARSSASFAYTFKPTVTATATIRFSDAAPVSDADGSDMTALPDTGTAAPQSGSPPSFATDVHPDATDLAPVAVAGIGNLAWTSPAPDLKGSAAGSAATSTLGYTYTPTNCGTAANSTLITRFTNDNSSVRNVARSVAASASGFSLGPVPAHALVEAGRSASGDTPTSSGTPANSGPAAAAISFGTLGYKHAARIYPELRKFNAGALGLLSDPAIDKYSITAAQPRPSASSPSSSLLIMPIIVVNAMGAGVLSSSLTIFTDESVAMGGLGGAFTYALTALDIAEPAAFSLLAAGFVGLAGFRHWRRAAR